MDAPRLDRCAVSVLRLVCPCPARSGLRVLRLSALASAALMKLFEKLYPLARTRLAGRSAGAQLGPGCRGTRRSRPRTCRRTQPAGVERVVGGELFEEQVAVPHRPVRVVCAHAIDDAVAPAGQCSFGVGPARSGTLGWITVSPPFGCATVGLHVYSAPMAADYMDPLPDPPSRSESFASSCTAHAAAGKSSGPPGRERCVSRSTDWGPSRGSGGSGAPASRTPASAGGVASNVSPPPTEHALVVVKDFVDRDPLPDRPCEVCEGPIDREDPSARYCSETCRKIPRRRSTPSPPLVALPAEDWSQDEQLQLAA